MRPHKRHHNLVFNEGITKGLAIFVHIFKRLFATTIIEKSSFIRNDHWWFFITSNDNDCHDGKYMPSAFIGKNCTAFITFAFCMKLNVF